MNKSKIIAYMFLYSRALCFARVIARICPRAPIAQKSFLLAGILWAVFCTSACSRGTGTEMYLEAKTQADPSGTWQSSPDTDGPSGTGQGGTDTDSPSGTCFVYVCGAVKRPGVYELPEGSRIYEAIGMAGGLRKNASVKGINQAQIVADGDMIEILTEGERQETGGTVALEQSGKVDINTASAAELMTLNGIGEAKAANIIAYREHNGKFSSMEELMEVDGIGEGVYAKIQDKITVTQ